MKRINAFILLAFLMGCSWAIPSYTITPVSPFPVKVQSGSTTGNIKYNIHNNTAGQLVVGFVDLAKDGVTPSTNCANLAANSDCSLNLTFVAPPVPAGKTEIPYTHWFGVTGGTSTVGYVLSSKILQAGPSHLLTIKSNITFDTSATTSDTFDLALADLNTAHPYLFPDVPFGTYTLPQQLPVDPYQVTIAPNSVTGSDSNTYKAPASFHVSLTTDGQIIQIPYKKSSTTVAVTTNITAPNLGTGTVAIGASDGTDTYSGNQASGSNTYANMVPGNYNITAASYTGSDSNTYNPTVNNPYLIDSTHTVIPVTYTVAPPPSSTYDWQTGHLNDLKEANVFAVFWGGGSTTGPIKISTNPPINPFLNSTITSYYTSTVPVQTTAQVPEFPSYIAMGGITEQTPDVNSQLSSYRLDMGNHYEGNGRGDFVDGVKACFWDDATCAAHYTPQVDALAAQSQAVKTATGRDFIAGNDFYTVDWSEYPTAPLDDVSKDEFIAPHLYNLMWDVQRMQYWHTQGVKMVLLLNPDSTVLFQKCAQYYCPISWKPKVTNDSTTVMVQIPNLAADFKTALDRMKDQGYITSPQETTILGEFNSSGILTPPSGSGRTVAGIPELMLVNSFIVRTFGPNVPFGYGNNVYDNNNALLNNGNPAAWETGAATWVHKVNHMGLSDSDRNNAIQFEATKFSSFLNDMNFSGNPSSTPFKKDPDFLFFDKYERDDIPGFVQTSWAWNGVDWDTYLKYVKETDAGIGNIPIAFWQMPGSSFQITGATFSCPAPSTCYSSATPDWFFGDASLNNNFSNIASSLNFGTISVPADFYFTQNSKAPYLTQYMQLTSESP